MRRPDHNIYRDWLTMDAEGELSPAQRAELEEHLASCASCRAEREDLLALDGLLRKHSVAVRPDFKDAVLSSLPTAGWESRHPKTWSFPAAVVLLLAGIAAALFGSAQLGTAESSGSGSSALLAVAGLVRATVQAGAGLLAASWKGAGLVIGEVIASPVSLAALAVLVVCLNLILISMLRRKRAATAGALGRSGSNGERI